MDNDDGLIAVVTYAGRLVWPVPAAMSETVWCVCWWDGSEVRRTYLPDQPGAEAYAQARHGIIVRLFPDRPWPTVADVKAAFTHGSHTTDIPHG